MSTVTINLDNLTTEERETVRRLAKKNKSYWMPEDGEPFWYINNAGYVEYGCFSYAIPEHRFYLEIGNCFRTEWEAEEALTRLKMQTKWKRLSLEAGEAVNPWNGKHKHWVVCFDNGLCYLDYTCANYGTTHFPSRESLDSAVAELGEENVKKYILGVEE